jgi:hypothetical protein
VFSHFGPFFAMLEKETDEFVIFLVSPGPSKLKRWVLFEVGLEEAGIMFSTLFSCAKLASGVDLVQFLADLLPVYGG